MICSYLDGLPLFAGLVETRLDRRFDVGSSEGGYLT